MYDKLQPENMFSTSFFSHFFLQADGNTIIESHSLSQYAF